MRRISILLLTILVKSYLCSQQLTVSYENLPSDPFANFAKPVGMAILKFEGSEKLDQEIFEKIKRIPAIQKGFNLFSFQVLENQISKLGLTSLDPSIPKVQKSLHNKLDISVIMTGKTNNDGGFICVFMATTSGDEIFRIEFKQSSNSNSMTDLIRLLIENKKPIYQSKPLIQEGMVLVEGGTFQMGSNDGNSDEKPVHTVTVDSFYIGKYEVTVAQYGQFCGATGRRMTPAPKWGLNNNGPIVYVSWESATAYCTWAGGRLPTEAEWEYAARGGNKSRGYKYSGSDDLDDVGWYGGNSSYRMHQAGTKQSNELGIYDMSGNAWEWCSDWYDGSYYGNSPSNNPQGPSSGDARILRGGWDMDVNKCRVTLRNKVESGIGDWIGFRFVQDIK